MILLILLCAMIYGISRLILWCSIKPYSLILAERWAALPPPPVSEHPAPDSEKSN